MANVTPYRILVCGTASGETLRLDQPLSLWGGLDPESGVVIDRNHTQAGELLTGRIVIMSHGRGSSSSSSVLAEAMRLGTAPAGFLLEEADPILAVGALVGENLYGVQCPMLVGPLPDTSLPGEWEINGSEFNEAVTEDGSLG